MGEKASGAVIVTHDDRLVMRGQKHEIGLSAEWWKEVPKTGEVTGYWNKDTGAHRSRDEGPAEGFKPTISRKAKLLDDVWIMADKSFMDIRLLNLWGDFGSRYRKGLEAVVSASMRGVLTYRREAPATERNRREAMRNRVKRHWGVIAYENDLVILAEDIGRVLMRELKPHDESGREDWEAIYLKGFKGTSRKEKPILIKAYDMFPRHGVKGWKVEVTFRNGYMKAHKLKGPENWLTQPNIQGKLRKSLIKEWGEVFKMAPEAKGMLAEALEVKQPELFDFMANTTHTLTELTRRMERQERETEAVRRETEALQRRVKRLETS